MASRKKRKKKKKRPSPGPAASAASTASADADGGDDDAHDSEGADADDDDGAEAADAADDDEPVEDKPARQGRKKRRRSPDQAIRQEVVPSPDGPRVSNNGGLIFVAVVLGLITLAVVVQFAVGN